MVLSASTTCHFPCSQHNNHGSILLFLLPVLNYIDLVLLAFTPRTKWRPTLLGSFHIGRTVLAGDFNVRYLPCLKETMSFMPRGIFSLCFHLICPSLTHRFDSDTQEISSSICITPFWSYGQDPHRLCRFHYANASKHITKPHRVRGATAF